MTELRIASILFRSNHRAGEAADVVPEAVADMLALADAARDRHDWASAAQYYRRALAQHPSRDDLFVQLGHACKELGDFDAAETAYRRFLTQHPQDPDIHLQLGHLHNRMDDPETALAWYSKAHALASDDGDIVRHMESSRLRLSRSAVEHRRHEALQLVRSGRWHQAQPQLHSLVTDGEDDLIAIYANVTKETGDFDAALKLYEDYRTYAQAKDPKSAIDVEIQVGHLYKAMGRTDLALQYYIAARDAEFWLYGYVMPDSACEREITACIAGIYTCFWRPQ
jgi:tetratricopeptide (TPR) repeat protein